MWRPCSSPPSPGPGVLVLRDDDSYGGKVYLLATWERWTEGDEPQWWRYPGEGAPPFPLSPSAEWLALEDRQ